MKVILKTSSADNSLRNEVFISVFNQLKIWTIVRKLFLYGSCRLIYSQNLLMEDTSPENFLDVRHGRPDAISTRCGFFGCCRGSGGQFGANCGSSCFTSNHRVEPVIFAPTDDVYLDLKPGRRIRVIYKTASNAIKSNSHI